MCVDKLTINEQCNVDICFQCNDLVGLLCQVDLNGNYFCECSLYQYWNGSVCVNLETINEPCTNSSQCNSYDGLFCNNSICSCHPLYTWNQTTCGKYLIEFFILIFHIEFFKFKIYKIF